MVRVHITSSVQCMGNFLVACVVSGLAPSCEQHSLCYERDFVKRFYKSQRYYK